MDSPRPNPKEYFNVSSTTDPVRNFQITPDLLGEYSIQ